jgi:hypothetical protein
VIRDVKPSRPLDRTNQQEIASRRTKVQSRVRRFHMAGVFVVEPGRSCLAKMAPAALRLLCVERASKRTFGFTGHSSSLSIRLVLLPSELSARR